MSKPRVIIADTEVSYIAPLQLKFARDFFDLIDVEIITDRDYFYELFSKPQKAEILIVSEEMYDVSLQKHNIANVFVMLEQYEEEKTGDLSVVKLFKYTSIKEIFNEIVGRSAASLNIESVDKKETQIVVVTSAAGGVGKTTIAMGVSKCLSQNYKRVLYINASRLQAFQYLLDNNSKISAPEIYSYLANPGEKIYSDIKHIIRNEIFNYLPPFKASLMSVGLDFLVYEKIAISAKESKDYDFIIIDLENTFDEYMTRLIDIADKVVVVTKQTIKEVHCTNQFIANISGINSDKYLFVCNDFDKEKDNVLIRADVELKFSIGEYVEHIDNFDCKRISDYVNESGIQKTTFWVL